MSLSKMILHRTILGLLTLLAVSFVISGALSLLPGDFAQAILGQSATPEAVAAIRHDLGLDQPFLSRYLNWLLGALHGDFGTSLTDHKPVIDLVWGRLINTLILAGLTAVIAIPLSIIVGAFSALYRKSFFDRLSNFSALASLSSPEFVLGYVLLLLFAVHNHWLSPVSTLDDRMTIVERLYATALPALTLSLVVGGYMMRMTRAAIVNLLALPYIEMAGLKGMGPSRIVFHDALPNAAGAIANVVAFNLAYLVTGVVVVEVVFAYPGIGQLFVDSVTFRNVPIVQACCLIFAVAYIGLNMVADIITIISNPRLRHPK